MAGKSFCEIRTRKDLADKLSCDIKALDYVSFVKPKTECSSENCHFPAVEQNNGYCVCHRKFWYPRDRITKSKRRLIDRGHLLLGPEYLIENCGVQHGCDCDNGVCLGMGYTRSMFAFPTDCEIRAEWYTALGNSITKAKKDKIDKNPRNFKLAYWHFDPSHLIGGKERYEFRKQAIYVDADRKQWKNVPHYPPPNGYLCKHIYLFELLIIKFWWIKVHCNGF